MEIKELDLETRNKIYSHTKSILRKYQKGIVTGKLTADKLLKIYFVMIILIIY